MAGYGTSCDRCRFCGLDLPSEAASAMAHYNTHWRQTNGDIVHLTPCAYEPQVNIRIGPAAINPEDLEVSGHLEHQNFQYSYSPQTEPSNLSLTGTRCSPLNLTGRPKSESPLTSPLASPLPTDSQQTATSHSSDMNTSINSQQTPLQNIGGMHHELTNDPQQYANYNNGMFSNCQISSQIMSTLQINETLDMSSHTNEEPHEEIGCDLVKTRKRIEREIRCHVCSRIFYSKNIYDEHFHTHHSKNINTHSQNLFLMNNEHIESNRVQTVSNVMPCTFNLCKPYKCSICDQEFMYREELTEHANNHEAAKPYRCDICGTGLSHVSALRRHILSHSGHKPHTCDICSRGFFQKWDLMRHYSTHGKKKNIECNNCKKKYFSDYFYKTHKCKQAEAEVPKPFKCDICGNSCSTSIAWNYHMWKHTKNPAFVPFQRKENNQSLVVNVTEKNI